MPFDDKELIRVSELLLRLCEGQITDLEMEEIREFASMDKDAAEYCAEVLINNSYFKQGEISGFTEGYEVQSVSAAADSSAEQLQDALKTMAEYEKTAATIEIFKEKPGKELIQNVIYPPREKRKLSKFNITTLIISMAAMLFFIVYVKLNPVPAPQQIAVLSDSVNARWAYPKLDFQVGEPIYSEMMELTEGFVELSLKNGTKLVVEGPARFQFEDSMQVFFEQGKLTARVTPEAIGYSVRTPFASIVDYGTEFGVFCDSHKTQAHVFSGKVEIRTGSDVRRFEQSMRLRAGQAAKVTTGADSIQKVQPGEVNFCRDIPTPYQVYAKSLKPYTYWHFNKQAAEPLLDIMNPETSKNQIAGDFSWRQGPVLGDNKTCSALGFSGRKGISIGVPETNVEKGFTWSFWVKLDSISPSAIMTTQASTHPKNILEVKLDQNGHLVQNTYIAGRGDGYNTMTSDHDIQQRQWYHVVVTGKHGHKKRLYVDGQLSAVSPEKIGHHPDKIEIFNTYYFGSRPNDQSVKGEAGLRGAVCEIVFYDYMLTYEQISRLYETSQTGNV